VTGTIGYRAQPAVAPSASSPGPGNISPAPDDSRRAQAVTAGTSREAIIDPQTDVVVFRSLDAYTGAVIEQVPAQALLRQRAYVDAQAVRALIEDKNPAVAALTPLQA
jgi:hypothetical protein